MTLPSRQNIQNMNPGGLRPSSLPLGHNIESLQASRQETFYFLKFECALGLSKHAALTTAPVPPP